MNGAAAIAVPAGFLNRAARLTTTAAACARHVGVTTVSAAAAAVTVFVIAGIDITYAVADCALCSSHFPFPFSHTGETDSIPGFVC